MTDLPALDPARFPPLNSEGAAPRFLLLCGSERPASLSRLLVAEAARLLEYLGGETRIFDPAGLSAAGNPADNPRARELHQAALWSDAQLWCSPENYGTMSAVMKMQLDSCPPAIAGEPLFGGKPLATVQVCGAGPSFSTLTALASAGRWLGMFVTPAQLCVPKVQEEFGEDGRMKPSIYYDKLVELVEELYKTTVALRGCRGALLDRYGARAAA